MNIIKWEPFNYLENRSFDFPEVFKSLSLWDIDADLYEQNNKIIAKVNVPGINPDNIKIEVEDRMLHIWGEQKEDKEEKNRNYYRREIRKGDFRKVISLPANIKKDAVVAHFKNGVLEIVMEKINKEKPQKIEIKVSK